MQRLQVQQDWFDRLLPEGLPIPSVTLLSGPGGSGKPLIGNLIAAAWLRQGGSVVFMSLQYPDHSFIVAGLKAVAQLDLDDYQDRVAFIELDTSLDDMTPPSGNWFKANVVKPSVWDAALARACAMVPDAGPGILVFCSAVNLLLFSPTYGRDILDRMKSPSVEGASCSYLFSASTTARKEDIAELEEVADNLIMSRSTRAPFQLHLQIERITGAPFVSEEIHVPFSSSMLTDVKEIADHSRKRVIPQVRKM